MIMNRIRYKAGLSLMETAVGMIILGAMLSVLIPNILEYYDEARISRTREEMLNLSKAVARYRLQTGWWPAEWAAMTQRQDGMGNAPLLSSKDNMAVVASGGVHPVDPWGGYYTLRCYVRKEYSGLTNNAVGWVPITYTDWQLNGITLLNKGAPATVLSANTTFEVMVVSVSNDFNVVTADFGVPAAPPIQSYLDEVSVVGAEKVSFAGTEHSVQ